MLGQPLDVDATLRVLADAERPRDAALAQQIRYGLLPDLQRGQRHAEPAAVAARAQLLHLREDLHGRTRHHARQLELRLQRQRRRRGLRCDLAEATTDADAGRRAAPVRERPVYRVRLAGARLPVCEDRAVEALEHIVDHLASYRLVRLRLGRAATEHGVDRELSRVVEGLAQQNGGRLRMLLNALLKVLVAELRAHLHVLVDRRADAHGHPDAVGRCADVAILLGPRRGHCRARCSLIQ